MKKLHDLFDLLDLSPLQSNFIKKIPKMFLIILKISRVNRTFEQRE